MTPGIDKEIIVDTADTSQTVDARPLTERESGFIKSNKYVILDITDEHVLLKLETKSYRLYEIRERRNRYLQLLKNFTTEPEAVRYFDSLLSN